MRGRFFMACAGLAAAAVLSVACGSGGSGSNTPTAEQGLPTGTATAQASPTAPAGTPTSFPQEVQLTQLDNGKTVQLARGGTLIIALPANPDSGNTWSVAESTSSSIVLQGAPTYVPPGSTNPAGNAPGTQVFTFKASASASEPATAQVVLDHTTTGPSTPPHETFTVTVILG